MRRPIDPARGIDVENADCEPDNQIGPNRRVDRRRDARSNDGEIREHVVARYQERGPKQVAAVTTTSGQHISTAEINR